MDGLKLLLGSKKVQNALGELIKTIEKRKHELVFFNTDGKVGFYFVTKSK